MQDTQLMTQKNAEAHDDRPEHQRIRVNRIVKKKLFLFSPLASLVVVLEWFPNDVDDKKVQESQSRLSASSRMPAERGIRHDFAVFFCSTNERISRLASDSGARAERFLGEGVKFLLRLNEG